MYVWVSSSRPLEGEPLFGSSGRPILARYIHIYMYIYIYIYIGVLDALLDTKAENVNIHKYTGETTPRLQRRRSYRCGMSTDYICIRGGGAQMSS